MNPSVLARVERWLRRPEVAGHDPPRVAALLAALPDGEHVTALRHGGVVCYALAPRRRLLEFDRRGAVTAACAWDEHGALRWAACRTAHGQRIGIEPGAGSHPAWGRSDRLWRLAAGAGWAPLEPLSVFQAANWSHPDFIPALAEPARLPPGAGTAVLNLLAGLMKDCGVARVRYRGPYPTEHLFTALLESFRCDPAAGAPLEAFAAGGGLDWLPAPHERHGVADGICVQLRHQVEKVVLHGVPFYRADWQGVIRREPRLVRSAGERVVCSLWALGRSIEDRLVLDPSGEVLAAPEPVEDRRPASPMPPVWKTALAEMIARESPPLLAGPIAETLAAAALEWGPVPGDLVQAERARLRVSRALRDAGMAWVREASSVDERGQRAARLALEVARLVAPAVRLSAQQHLAALPEDEQQRRWDAADSAPRPAFSESAGRLLALIVRGNA